MRVNSCGCGPLRLGDWACESMTVEDAVSPIMGVVDLDVVEDVITNKAPVLVRDNRTLYRVQRRIVGFVAEHLSLWPEVWREMQDTNGSVQGISLPEEGKTYLKGQVALAYDWHDHLLEIVVWDAVWE